MAAAHLFLYAQEPVEHDRSVSTFNVEQTVRQAIHCQASANQDLSNPTNSSW
jgi:hypothetical protein